MTLKLKKINLNKGEDQTHPDINLKKTYLAKIDGVYHIGKFNKQWYGLNFDGWKFDPGVGIQYDKPGTNCSDWEGLWELQGRP